jgi:Leucine-rich repeat (LRR) protein
MSVPRAGLVRVREIDLHGNLLANMSGGPLAGAPDLRAIDLSGNRLTTIDGAQWVRNGSGCGTGGSGPDRCNTTHSGSFDLDAEERGGGTPQLVNLSQVNLEDNRLIAIESGAFPFAANLTTLYLGGNRLAYMDPLAFKFNPKLATLSLSRNRIRTIPSFHTRAADGSPNAPCLCNQTRLDLSHNLDRPHLSHNQTASCLCNLTRLDLSHNQIASLPFRGFASAARLRNLSVAFNAVTEIQPGAFAGLSRLSLLDLTNNSVTKLVAATFSGTCHDLWANPPCLFSC